MSYNKVNKNKNYLLAKQDQHKHFMFCVHRARVTDIYVDKGTVSVELEDVPYSAEVGIPLMGLSMPPQKNENDINELNASWGRYIPQQGDVILVGFSPNGTLYSFGYHAMFYEGFNYKDIGRESKGGIGWGEASAKQMKPGDWDWKSARGSSFYLGDKAKLSSGPHNITVNKSTGDITTKSSLVVDKYGVSSETRYGGARRKILPTDPAETSIYNLSLQVAQESTDVVRRGFPPLEMCRTSMGDVIDETKFQVMVSTLGGTTIRRLESVKDPTGFIDFYAKKVDDLGNYGVEAPSAVMFQWATPLASWDIKNNITSITSTVSFDVTSPLITLKAAIKAVIDSANVQLGGPAAVEPLVKGNQLVSVLTSFLTTVATTCSAAVDPATTMAAVKAIGVAAATLAGSLSGVLSIKVKTE